MFLAHFGAAFAVKPLTPKTSLGTLLLASLWIDLLWPTLLLLGIERVAVAPGATVVTPLVFEHYPYSHSLLAALLWAAALALVYAALKRDGRGAACVAGLVVSHWLLDAIVHPPDLPLWPFATGHAGLGAWNSLPLTLLLECGLLALGVGIYLRHTQALDAWGRWAFITLVVLLLFIYMNSVFGSPPPSPSVIAWAAQLQWLFVLWGYFLDRRRAYRPSAHTFTVS